jgi:predicted Zn-dependent peptidase
MYQRITLPNGVRILYERIEQVRSVSIGVWVMNGSRHEPKKLSGISHFIEHMVFKGTHTRTAADIAGQMDAIGGQVNAFTTKECTCFYARVLDTHLRTATEILGDMLFNAKFDENEVSIERGVILEEIGMYNDSPEDIVAERLMSAIFAPTSLSRPILGTPSTLKSIDGEAMRKYTKEYYSTRNTLIAISGSFTDDDIRFISELFSGMEGGAVKKPEKGRYTPAAVVRKKATEQNHMIIAFEGPPFGHPDRYANAIMSNILGGGMSSRLFRKIREEHGLCYSIYTYISSFSDTGIFGIYTATGKDTEKQALGLIAEVIDGLLQNGVTEEELNRAREQSKANVLLALENTIARMNSLARGELFVGEVLPPDEIIRRYDAVNRESVLNSARNILDMSRVSLSAVGRVETPEAYMEMIRSRAGI